MLFRSNGWPLYYFRQDAAPKETKGQNVGGNWFVVSPEGGPRQNQAVRGNRRNDECLHDLLPCPVSPLVGCCSKLATRGGGLSIRSPLVPMLHADDDALDGFTVARQR